ncbi:MAG TPA: putative beta-lysine N-acetyltransferase [Desulfopila sp.]|nr:putative beta-lysine N-acetyltransferase [Desulfopila sp.]
MDTVETILGSTVQHGPHNRRVYLIHLDMGRLAELDTLLDTLDSLARANSYSKIFAKIPAPAWSGFEATGYVLEATVPNFFQGQTDCYFIAKYFSATRADDQPDERLGKILLDDPSSSPVRQTAEAPEPTLPGVELCTAEDAVEMSEIYRRVFASYPFPIKDPAYIAETMTADIRYYCTRRKGAIAALASAELDLKGQNAELTDFATLPEHRRCGMAAALLKHMEAGMVSLGLKTLYTIARAESFGMNMVFKQCGYLYAGFLANNTQISGDIQSMTVWYKHLGQ